MIKKYIKPYIGKYRLSTITSVRLNTFITELCEEYDFSRAYFKSILKVVKGSFRDACDLYGFLKYNPAITLRLPRLDKEKEDIKPGKFEIEILKTYEDLLIEDHDFLGKTKKTNTK